MRIAKCDKCDKETEIYYEFNVQRQRANSNKMTLDDVCGAIVNYQTCPECGLELIKQLKRD